MAELKERTMEKEFIPFEIALSLKELGFDEPCFSFYRKEKLYLCDYKNVNEEKISIISAPLYQQAFKFFKERYNFISEINVYSTSDGYSYTFKILCKKYTPYKEANNAWVTYEEAELECIKKLIEIAKGQNVK